jgi:threonine dehydratase
MSLDRPTFKNILEAREIIKTYLPKTPLYSYPAINDLLGTSVFIKHENHLPTVSFKIRGGINLMHNLGPEERERGVVTASTGNHALSIATAGRLFSVPVTIVMPEESNPVKVKAIRSLGAEIIFHGQIFEEAKDFADRLGKEKSIRFVLPGGPGNEAGRPGHRCPGGEGARRLSLLEKPNDRHVRDGD